MGVTVSASLWLIEAFVDASHAARCRCCRQFEQTATAGSEECRLDRLSWRWSYHNKDGDIPSLNDDLGQILPQRYARIICAITDRWWFLLTPPHPQIENLPCLSPSSRFMTMTVVFPKHLLLTKCESWFFLGLTSWGMSDDGP